MATAQCDRCGATCRRVDDALRMSTDRRIAASVAMTTMLPPRSIGRIEILIHAGSSLSVSRRRKVEANLLPYLLGLGQRLPWLPQKLTQTSNLSSGF